MAWHWRLFYIGVLWRAGSYPMLFCFCCGSCYCTKPVVGKFPVPPVSVVFHCNLCVCVCNDVLVVLKCIMFGAFCSVLLSFSVFSLPPHPLLLLLVLLLSLFLHWNLSSVCGCLGRGWVWLAGLVAGLQVGQTFGVFLLPGLGVGGSSP